MRPRPEQPINTLILRDLADGPATVVDLEQTISIHRRNLRYYMKILKDDKLVHISGWEQRTGPALPVFALGNKRDAPRPKQKHRRYKTSEILPDVIAT